ncbi:Cytochrome P450 94A1 [Cocos nucifera]|nr:Cytochrome P450 94A1 [Cocos nucifera]
MADWLAEVLAASPTNTLTFSRPGGVRGVITANPANVEHILRSNFDNYPKGSRFASILHDFLGRGIFNSDGEVWRLQRKTASFEFNTRSLRSFVVHCVQDEILQRLLPLLAEASLHGRSIDLQDVLERFAFDNVCKVAYNHDPACLAADGPEQSSSGFAEAFKDAANLSAGRFRYAVPRFWKIKKLLRIGSERRLKKSIATVHAFANQIIRSRKKENRTSSSSRRADDLLSRFVANEDHSEEFLRDIVISFLLAGRETTSSALSWFFWLLSSRPEVERKIVDDIRSVRSRNRSSGGGGKTTFDFEELREMHYLHAAITEAMRLYPPVPMNSTECQEDDVLPDGTAVKKGWFMSYNSYAMGRMEAIWGKDCLEYKPERWLEEGLFRPESPFKFAAFHGGPRMCLGKEMAYIQMKSIAACMLERFVIEVVDKETCPEKMMSLTLRMRGGLPVRVMQRLTAAID